MRDAWSISRTLVAAWMLTCAVAAHAQGPAPATAPASLIRTSSTPNARVAPSPGPDPARVIASLAIVIGGILLLRWAIRRFLRLPSVGTDSNLVKVLSRTPISPKQHLLALQVGRRVLIVADNGQQLSTLCEVSDERELDQFTARSSSQATRNLDENAIVVQKSERADSPVSASPRQEFQGLLSKVRSLSQQFK